MTLSLKTLRGFGLEATQEFPTLSHISLQMIRLCKLKCNLGQQEENGNKCFILSARTDTLSKKK